MRLACVEGVSKKARVVLLTPGALLREERKGKETVAKQATMR